MVLIFRFYIVNQLIYLLSSNLFRAWIVSGTWGKTLYDTELKGLHFSSVCRFCSALYRTYMTKCECKREKFVSTTKLHTKALKSKQLPVSVGVNLATLLNLCKGYISNNLLHSTHFESYQVSFTNLKIPIVKNTKFATIHLYFSHI